jgi:RecB family exonuclease
LENYVQLEDPRLVNRPNPVQREVWVRANLPVLEETVGFETKSTFLVRGIVDRLDMVKLDDGSVVMRLVDYKSGKAPHFKYSADMNAKIAEESFFQLKIYALLLKRTSKSPMKNNLDLRILRLLHLTSQGEGPAQYLDYDLGDTAEERNELLEEVEMTLRTTWSDICSLVAKQDPMLFQGCDRSFCYCHKCRPQFVPGSVWEP